MAFTEDRSVFFNTAEHADAAIYNGVTAVNGILSDDYADVIQGDQVGVSSSRPVFTYNADDISSPTTGVNLVVGSDTYVVRDIEVSNNIAQAPSGDSPDLSPEESWR